jgi:hypothetical protein
MKRIPNPVRDPDGYLRAVAGSIREAKALARLMEDCLRRDQPGDLLRPDPFDGVNPADLGTNRPQVDTD